MVFASRHTAIDGGNEWRRKEHTSHCIKITLGTAAGRVTGVRVEWEGGKRRWNG